MKNYLAITVLFFSLSPLFSQVEKGTKLIGVGFGSFSYTNSESQTTYSNTPTVYKSDGKSYSVSVNPSLGWFVINNLAVGGGITISFYGSTSKSSNTSSSTTSTSTYKQPSYYLSPFVRYYFKGDKGKVFAHANAQFGFYGGRSKSSTNTGSSSETITVPVSDWNAGLAAGYEYFINPYIGMYASVGFNYGKSETSYDYRPSTGTGYTYTSEYTRMYFPVNLGIQVHLGKKEK